MQSTLHIDLGGFFLIGAGAENLGSGLGKLGAEAIVQTGLETKGIIPDFLNGIDHTNFIFLDGLPLGLKVAGTLLVVAGGAIGAVAGWEVLGRGINNVKGKIKIKLLNLKCLYNFK